MAAMAAMAWNAPIPKTAAIWKHSIDKVSVWGGKNVIMKLFRMGF